MNHLLEPNGLEFNDLGIMHLNRIKEFMKPLYEGKFYPPDIRFLLDHAAMECELNLYFESDIIQRPHPNE